MQTSSISNPKSKIENPKPGISIQPLVLCLLCLAAAALVLAGPRPALAADGQLLLSDVDKETGQPIACRIHLQNANGRPVKIPGTVAWGDHFDFSGKVLLKLPIGNYTFVMERGLEYLDM